MISGMSWWALLLVALGMLTWPALLAIAVNAIFGWRYRRAVERGMSSHGAVQVRAGPAVTPRQEATRPPLALLRIDAPPPRIPRAQDLRRQASRAAGHVRWMFAAAGILQMAVTAALTHGALVGTPSAEVYPPLLTAFVTTAPGTILLAAFALRAARWRLALLTAWLAVALIIFLAGPDRVLANGPNVVREYARISIRDALLPLLPLSLLLVRRLRAALLVLVALGFYLLVGTALFMIFSRGDLVDLDPSRIRTADVSLAVIELCLGVAVVVWLVRRRRPTVPPFALLAAALAGAWALRRWALPDSELSTAALGIAANALQWYVLWLIFCGFVRLQDQRILPAEVLHWHVCWLFLALVAGQNFTVLLSVGNADVMSAVARGHAWGLAPFAANLILLQVVLHRIRGSMRGGAPPRLLLLRVFGSAAKRVRLLTLLGETLRRAVRVDYIASTDLAQRHVDASALEAFVRGQLDTLFLSSHAEVDARVDAFRERRDIELRYPLNELYCRANAWQYAVERLASSTNAVCMDLRGFSQHNLGCAFELGVLVRSVPLRHILLLVDATTDMHALASTLQTAWCNSSAGGANDGVAQPTIRALAVQGWSATQREILESWLVVTVAAGSPSSSGSATRRP
jgi:hypothetical protein